MESNSLFLNVSCLLWLFQPIEYGRHNATCKIRSQNFISASVTCTLLLDLPCQQPISLGVPYCEEAQHNPTEIAGDALRPHKQSEKHPLSPATFWLQLYGHPNQNCQLSPSQTSDPQKPWKKRKFTAVLSHEVSAWLVIQQWISRTRR